MPIFRIPYIPPGHKTPLYSLFGPTREIQHNFSLLLFSFLSNNQIRTKSEEVCGVVLDSHQEKRQCSRLLRHQGKVLYAFSKDVSPEEQPKGEGRAHRVMVKCVPESCFPAKLDIAGLSQFLANSELLNLSQACRKQIPEHSRHRGTAHVHAVATDTEKSPR